MIPRYQAMALEVLVPWLRCKDAHASPEKLADLNIRVGSFDFTTGRHADGSQQFFQPLPPSIVADLFLKTGVLQDPNDDVVRPGREDEEWLDNQQEARLISEKIITNLFGPGWQGILPTCSAWRYHG